MSGKNIALASLSVCLIVAVIFLFYQRFQLHQDPKVYNFTIETSDLRIKDIEFVIYPNSVYVSDHDLEVIGEDKQFNGVAYSVSIGGNMVLSNSQADDPFTLPDALQGKLHYTTTGLLQDVAVRKDDEVSIDVIYKVNGVTRNTNGTAKLKSMIKPFSTTGDHGKNVIRL